jgi:hypothetical protein
MSGERAGTRDPRVAAAVSDLQTIIRARYPTASFTTFHGEDPEGLYLRAAVDLDDPDEVMDLAIDRLMLYQLEQELPVYLLPVRSDARIAAALAERNTHKPTTAPLPHLSPR